MLSHNTARFARRWPTALHWRGCCTGIGLRADQKAPTDRRSLWPNDRHRMPNALYSSETAMHNNNQAPQRYYSQDWCHALWIQSRDMRTPPPTPKEVKPLDASMGPSRSEPQPRNGRL